MAKQAKNAKAAKGATKQASTGRKVAKLQKPATKSAQSSQQGKARKAPATKQAKRARSAQAGTMQYNPANVAAREARAATKAKHGYASIADALPDLRKLLVKGGVTVDGARDTLGLCRKSVRKLLAEAKAKRGDDGTYSAK
jgi:hypothetical protein